MAPAAIEPEDNKFDLNIRTKTVQNRRYLKSSGLLDEFKSEDVTPIIGTEYPDAKLTDFINAPNADEILRDLAIKISERGVVFFRAQDDLTNDTQKQLIQRLGELAGKPSTSGLHIHPILNSDRGLDKDPEISTISSTLFDKVYSKTEDSGLVKKGGGLNGARSSSQWHSDIAFEPAPADYTSLRLVQLPKTGGDTLWASGYEIYDRISPAYQRFLDGLTATFAQPGFNAAAARNDFSLYDKQRGSPDNVGAELKAVHPVVRTNPVTGWKSVFPVGAHVAHINGVTQEESDDLRAWFLRLVTQNHDLQVRFKWRNSNDIAIWDNRSVFHTATFDYEGMGERFGNRAVGVGERPFYDPNSTSRREALAAREA